MSEQDPVPRGRLFNASAVQVGLHFSERAMSEIAAHVITPTIVQQAYEAARAYPDLRILCPWCRAPVLGVDFAAHGGWHEREEALRDNVPSHWMAL